MCFWVCVLLLLLKGALSLRLLSLNVPTKVVVGDVITLSCGYDLEGDTLYSIKWYRDDVEFFRFVPRDRPPGQFFPLTGVQVDVVRSTNGTVYIHDTDVSTTGTYKCEVSADAPSFQTVSAQKVLVVSEKEQSTNEAASGTGNTNAESEAEKQYDNITISESDDRDAENEVRKKIKPVIKSMFNSSCNHA